MEKFHRFSSSFSFKRRSTLSRNIKKVRIIKNASYKIIQTFVRIITFKIWKNRFEFWYNSLAKNKKISASWIIRKRGFQLSL
jgi:hypothetical protein